MECFILRKLFTSIRLDLNLDYNSFCLDIELFFFWLKTWA